jgi:hypothetical protein
MILPISEQMLEKLTVVAVVFGRTYKRTIDFFRYWGGGGEKEKTNRITEFSQKRNWLKIGVGLLTFF